MYQMLESTAPAQRTTLAFIGYSGFNAQHRVLPELVRLNGRIETVGYDLRPPARSFDGIPCMLVQDNNELARRLAEQRPANVLIETTDDLHAEHIALALKCGARRVFCEKCLDADSDQAARLLTVVQAARPGQDVFVIDHYPLLNLVLTLHANQVRWLGRVKRLEVALFEAQGVPPHQEKSHAGGMANFFHHVVALAGLFFELADLEPVEAEWARHAEARVPDSYRAARFLSRRSGSEVVAGAVGKYMASPRKQVYVEGTHGRAWLDRDQAELRVERAGIPGVSLVRADADTGYGELAWALATGASLPALLSVEQAIQTLRLVEQAHSMARERPVYPGGDGNGFVCDWQLAALGPIAGW